MENTAIEWADHTFNPWIGCTKVSPGCDNCYAEHRMDKRLHIVQWGAGQPRGRTADSTWAMPTKWQRAAAAFHAQHGRRQRVFCASLADVFDPEVPPSWRADLFTLIRATPDLDWLLLTKRIGNAWKLMADACGVSMASALLPLPNVWLGATVVNQGEVDRDVPKLLRVPATVRFLSIEPMLGPITFDGVFASGHFNDGTNALEALDWVICGGESGPGARPMQTTWARALRDQCAATGTPFLFKQWGEWLGPRQNGAPDVPSVHINASDLAMRVGKRAAGRLLDGRTHDGFPQQP